MLSSKLELIKLKLNSKEGSHSEWYSLIVHKIFQRT